MSDYLNDYYTSYDEDSRLLSNHGRVEFLTTLRYIEKYLRPGMRILEIGAATGRYSHTLARQGYDVDAVELVQHNIDIFLENTLPDEKVAIRQGNALDLSDFASDTYDITLLLGPMYHLYTEADQLQALSEAVRVTKPGGVIFAAYCMADPAIYQAGFIGGRVHELIADGLLDPQTFSPISCPEGLFELSRVEEIAALREKLSVTPIALIGTDGCTNMMRQIVDSMDEETFRVYLDYQFSICERQDLIGMSNHTLDIFRKEG